MRIENSVVKKLIEGNLIFGLAGKTNVFAIDGRIYYTNKSTSGPNTFSFDRRSEEVKQGPNIETLEKKSEISTKEICLDFQQKLIDGELKRDANSDLGDTNYQKLVNFTFNELFPNLRKQNDEFLEKIFGDKKEVKKGTKNKTSEEQVDRYLQKISADLNEGITINIEPPRSTGLDSVLTRRTLTKSANSNSNLIRIANGYNIGIVNNKVYLLGIVKKGEDLRIGTKRYSLVPAVDFGDFANAYARNVLKKAVVSGLRDKLVTSEEFARVISEGNEIKRAMERGSYEEEDFGFIKRNAESIDVYIIVPEHVLKAPRTNELFYFSRHRLGISIRKDESSDGIKLERYPRALDRVVGPFYSDDMRDLCMGDYGFGYLSRGDMGKNFAKLLMDARNVVLHGYRRGNNPRKVLDEFNFRGNKISEAEFKRRKLSISNTNYQRGEENE